VTRRLVRAAVALALVSLVACAGSDPSPTGAGDATASSPSTGPDAATTTDATRSCPSLERAAPVEDGLPDLELPCLEDGPSVNLADLRGVPTVVNVWAAWCTNCDREMPLFADAVERAGDRVRFFGIHYKASREFGLRSVEDFGVPFPSAHDEDGDLVVQRLGAYAPPQTYYVTADGRVAGRKIGEITSQGEFDRLVQRYLGVSL
jgi:cytochrome c biogenesis protein CcmG/thiol:disulfide interchange protein DsbE